MPSENIMRTNKKCKVRIKHCREWIGLKCRPSVAFLTWSSKTYWMSKKSCQAKFALDACASEGNFPRLSGPLSGPELQCFLVFTWTLDGHAAQLSQCWSCESTGLAFFKRLPLAWTSTIYTIANPVLFDPILLRFVNVNTSVLNFSKDSRWTILIDTIVF